MARDAKSERIVHDVFAELRGFVPSRVKQTRRVRGKRAAEKQLRAIALTEAKKRGAKV